MPDETTGRQTETNTSISDLLRHVVEQEDLDSCQIMANVINAYLDAIKRRGNRSELFADDINRILNITRIMLAAGDIDQGFQRLVTKVRPLRGTPGTVG